MCVVATSDNFVARVVAPCAFTPLGWKKTVRKKGD